MTGPLPFLRRIGLGTAQFGLDYGITNRNGALSKDATAEILNRARTLGISLLDTAPAYGDSESVIGSLDPAGNFDIVTKLSPVAVESIGPADTDMMEREFDGSLKRLGRSRVAGVLVHHGRQLFAPGGEHLLALLNTLRDSGRAQKFGVSVYDGDEIDKVLERFTPDIIQVPISVADQRLIQSGHLEKLKNAGVEIHARSLFLQGTLLRDACDLPAFFATALPGFRNIKARARENGITSLQLCLAFAAHVPQLDRLIVGVSSVEEFAEITAAAAMGTVIDCDMNDLALSNPAMLDPSGWPSQVKP
tara:strand:- start:13283 stop:14197 length:915 start_codon:yes stop_codon:yes gene_type:complete